MISKFSIPLNESKGTLLGIETVTNLIKVMKRHPDVNPMKLKVDLFLHASCLGHLLRPNIEIKNHEINNVVNTIRSNNSHLLRLLPETTIKYEWARKISNQSDLTSKLFLTPTKIENSSFYHCGPIDYLREEYNPPQTELGIMSTDQCSVCKFPESCLIFLANLSRRSQPHRACKQRNRI